MTYSELYKEGLGLLSEADIAEAALDSRLLLEFICGTDRSTLYAHPEMPVSDKDCDRYLRLVKMRAGHVPLSHLTGSRDFMGLTFAVNENVLIPRQDTEILVEEAMRFTDDGMRVLDVCTGSGCIILSLKNYKNNLEAVGIDISEEALKVARENARLLADRSSRGDKDRGSELEGSIEFYQGDLYEALLENKGDKQADGAKGSTTKFDIIVSNPPYIRDDVIPTLMPEVRDFDPYIALSGGRDGLDFYRRIIGGAPDYLTTEGRIFLEIGHDQAEAVSKLLTDAGFKDIRIVKDYSGLDRVACGKLDYGK